MYWPYEFPLSAKISTLKSHPRFCPTSNFIPSKISAINPLHKFPIHLCHYLQAKKLINTFLQSVAYCSTIILIFFSSLLLQLRLQDQSLIALHTIILFTFLSPFGEPYFLTYPTCALKVWNVRLGENMIMQIGFTLSL